MPRDLQCFRDVLPSGMSEEVALALLSKELGFTRRESEIGLELLLARDDVAIVAYLGASPLTVKAHRREIRSKLNAENCRVAAARITAALWRYADRATKAVIE